MSARAAARMAWGSWLLSSLLVAASVVLYLLALGSTTGGERYFHYEDAAVGLVFGAIGALIVTHRQRNAVGWILCVAGLSGALGVFTDQYSAYGFVFAPGSLPAVPVVAWVGTWAWLPFFTLIPLLLLLFPDGRPPSPRWRPLARAVVAFTVAIMVVLAVTLFSEPLGAQVATEAPPDSPWAIAVVGVGVATLAALLVASTVGLALRWRRARSIERQQLKWFTTMALAGVAVRIASGFLPPDGSAQQAVNVVGLLLIPAGIPIAILRYRLYDIDRLVNRTLVYAGLTAVLGVVYLGGVLVLRSLLAPLTGESSWAVAGSTLAVAALFGPLRRRVQQFVDRRFYRRRYDAIRTVEAFNNRLRDEVDLDSLSTDLVTVVAQTLQPEQVSLWLRRETAAAR